LLIYVLLALMALSAILVIFCRDLLYAVISLGTLSVFTSILFYILGSPFASIMELSIGAGLITILFMATISLVEQPRVGHAKYSGRSSISFFALAAVVATTIWVALSLAEGVPGPAAAASAAALPEVLWGIRLLDVMGLSVVIFTASIGIGVLFRTEGGK